MCLSVRITTIANMEMTLATLRIACRDAFARCQRSHRHVLMQHKTCVPGDARETNWLATLDRLLPGTTIGIFPTFAQSVWLAAHSEAGPSSAMEEHTHAVVKRQGVAPSPAHPCVFATKCLAQSLLSRLMWPLLEQASTPTTLQSSQALLNRFMSPAWASSARYTCVHCL